MGSYFSNSNVPAWCGDVFGTYLVFLLTMEVFFRNRTIAKALLSLPAAIVAWAVLIGLCMWLEPLLLNNHIVEESLRDALDRPRTVVSSHRLNAATTITADALLIPLLAFLANCQRVYQRYNLHSVAYCEVQQLLSYVSVEDMSSSSYSSRALPAAFCHGPERKDGKKLNPNPLPVSPSTVSSLLEIRSRLMTSIDSAYIQLLPLLDRIADSTITTYRILSAINDPSSLSIIDRSFSSSYPPSTSYLITYANPYSARLYCTFIRRFMWPS